MADLDDLREGCNFGLGVASTNNEGSGTSSVGYEGSFITHLQSEDRQNRDAGI